VGTTVHMMPRHQLGGTSAGMHSRVQVKSTADAQLLSHEDLMKGIYSVGFKKPSKIQEKALPMLLNNP